MTESDWDRIRRAKDAHRDKLAALPFDAKLQIVERLRERTQALGSSQRAATALERQSASNAVFVPLSQENVVGANNVGVYGGNVSGVYGVNVSLAVVAAPQVLSSAVATTVVSQQVLNPAPPSVNPDERTR